MVGLEDRLGSGEGGLVKDICKLLVGPEHEGLAERLVELVGRLGREVTYLEDRLETRDTDIKDLLDKVWELENELDGKEDRIGELEEELREGRDGG